MIEDGSVEATWYALTLQLSRPLPPEEQSVSSVAGLIFERRTSLNISVRDDEAYLWIPVTAYVAARLSHLGLVVELANKPITNIFEFEEAIRQQLPTFTEVKNGR